MRVEGKEWTSDDACNGSDVEVEPEVAVAVVVVVVCTFENPK